MRAFGGSAHAGSGIRSILRRFSALDDDLRATPRAASRSTASVAARSSAVSSSAVACAATRSSGPPRPTSKTSDPRFEAQM